MNPYPIEVSLFSIVSSPSTAKPHDVFFFEQRNDSQPNSTLDGLCEQESISKYFSIDGDTDTGGVIEVKLNGKVSQATLCLSQKNDSCSEGYTLGNNQSFYMAHPTAGDWRLDLFSIQCDNISELNSSTLNLTLTDCVNDCGTDDKQGLGHFRTQIRSNLVSNSKVITEKVFARHITQLVTTSCPRVCAKLAILALVARIQKSRYRLRFSLFK